MNSKKKRRGQMSEAFCTAMFLSLSGGLQDVYTYLFRGKVFANAQTGNIVLMAVHAFAGEWGRVLHYLVPLCFFALGVFAAELMHQKLQNLQRLHWRQLVVLCEIVMLFVVGFFPQEWNLMANALVSFACAMQVQTFRKVNGYAFASTMCIGNMRSGMDSLCSWVLNRNPAALKKSFYYWGIILLFALGAGLALPLCKAVDKAPVLQCPQKDFLGQILRPGFVPAEIETEVFQPVPEGLVQQLPHGASSFHCVVLPVRRRRPGKCWIDPEKNKPSVSLALASSPTRGAFGMAVNSVKLRGTP